MKQYLIGYGVNRIESYFVAEYKDLEAAELDAWREACEDYDGMAGLHGIRTEEEIMEEDELDEADADITYMEERENQIDYEAVLYDEEKHKDYL